jgi:Ca-activated chloride channel homolog
MPLSRPIRRALLAAVLVSPAALSAQGTIVPRSCQPPRPQPRPLPEPAPMRCVPAQQLGVVRTRSDVRVELVDRVLRYEVEERFVNRGGAIGEADYLYPLPKGAAFQDLKLSINGEMVAGETMSADEARRIYEEIVRRQRDPALVEWMGQGLLRTRIFPFQPGEERRVIVRFQVVAEREGDALRVDYRGPADPAGPMQQGRPGMGALPPDGWGPPAERDESERGRGRDRDAAGRPIPTRPGAAFTLVLPQNAPYGSPYSPTHRLDARDRDGRREVSVRGAARDVVVLLPMRRTDAAAVTLLPHAPGTVDGSGRDAGGYALVTVSPPAARSGAVSPRDVTLVLDVSGSMSGRKMEQARAAGRQLLATLRPQDRFRIIDFSTEVNAYPSRAMDESGFLRATPANVRAAERHLAELEAQGSTNISGALEEALRPPTASGRLPLVLFLTDGEPTVGLRAPDAIAELAAKRRGDRRIFTFGVGAELNAALVEQLALEGRGTATFVRPEESVERAVGLVASRLVDPVLTNVRVTADGVRLSRLHPQLPADLFAGQDLVLLARYHGSGRARLTIEGDSRDGPVRWTQTVELPAHERGNAFVARLWAVQRIGWLSAERRKHGANAEVDDEIRTLGERFGIPTEFTSYLVLEPGMVATDGARRMSDARGRVGSGVAGGVAGGVAPPPPAPAAAPQTANAARERAFDQAKTAAEQRSAVSLEGVVTTGAGGDAVRRAAGRSFALRDGRWTDVAWKTGDRVVKVRPYSDAWFALAAELPDLKETFALGERVLVGGRGLALEVAPDGAASLDAATMKAVVAALRVQ